MNTYYETFLKKDIFPKEPRKAEIVMDVYDRFPSERHYICLVLDDYVHGASRYETYKRLQYHIIMNYEFAQKKQSYLDLEFAEKL